jgi:hypothetical protein
MPKYKQCPECKQFAFDMDKKFCVLCNKKREKIGFLGRLFGIRHHETTRRVNDGRSDKTHPTAEKAYVGYKISDPRYCYLCNAKINPGSGYLSKGTYPYWMEDLISSGKVITVSSKIGISCELPADNDPHFLWLWYCYGCGSTNLKPDTREKKIEDARYFWRTGKPPK